MFCKCKHFFSKMAEDGEDTPPKLQMNHGFMRSIIKNQVERDEYHKSQKVQKIPVQRKPVRQPRNTNRRAPMQVYTPPGARSRQPVENVSENVSDISQEDLAIDEPTKTVAFRLEYLDNEQNVSTILVHEGDDPKTLAETFGEEIGLDSTLQNALYHRIKDEMAAQTSIPNKDWVD